MEAGEECDCGWEEDCKEKCCYPMRSVQMPNEKPCTLRRHMVCSPSQVPLPLPFCVQYKNNLMDNACVSGPKSLFSRHNNTIDNGFFMSLLLHQGPCCTEDCHLRYDVKCRDDNGCRDAAYCDGTGPKCPDSNNKPNKTVCSGEFVCFMGVSQSHFFKLQTKKKERTITLIPYCLFFFFFYLF